MDTSEQRQHARCNVAIETAIRRDHETIPAALVDVSEGGIGIVCERNFPVGATVQILFAYMDAFAVHGAVKWTRFVSDDKGHYRMGLAADKIVIVSEDNLLQGSGRSEFVKKLLAAAAGRPGERNQALEDSEERLRLALESAGLGLWDHDPATGRTIVGLQLRELLGLKPDRPEVTLQDFFATVHEADRARLHKRLREILGSGSDKLKEEFRITRQNGEIRWLWAAGRLYRDDAGRPIRMTGVNYDITERKLAEESRREDERKFRSLFENLREAAAIYEPLYDAQGRTLDGIIRDANPRWLAGIGRAASRRDVIGKRLSEIFGPEAVAPYSKRITELIAAGEPREFETFFVPLDRYYLISVFPIGKNLVASAAIDITDIKKSEEMLRRARDELETKVRERTAELNERVDQLAWLSSELTLAEERERRRLAEKLHDHLQQLIVGAKINLETLSAAAEADRQPVFERIGKLLAESLQATRLLTAELSPPVLEEGNLSAALEWLGAWMQENHGLKVELQVEPEIVLKGKDLALLLFRSVRELLFNVVKHAGVKSARLELVGDREGQIRIAVRDQGKGFDAEDLRRNINRSAGFGLLSVRERLALMGGRLEVESAPGQGAAFTLIVPMEKI